MTKYFPTPLLLLFFLLNSFQVDAAFPVKKKKHKYIHVGELTIDLKKTTGIFDFSKQFLHEKYNSENNGNLILSFTCVLIGVFIATGIMGLLAIIFGAISLSREMKKIAALGIALGAIELIIGLIVISAASNPAA